MIYYVCKNNKPLEEEEIKEERYFVKTTFKKPMNDVLTIIDKTKAA